MPRLDAPRGAARGRARANLRGLMHRRSSTIAVVLFPSWEQPVIGNLSGELGFLGTSLGVGNLGAYQQATRIAWELVGNLGIEPGTFRPTHVCLPWRRGAARGGVSRIECLFKPSRSSRYSQHCPFSSSQRQQRSGACQAKGRPNTSNLG
jgi:hypothetical protein